MERVGLGTARTERLKAVIREAGDGLTERAVPLSFLETMAMIGSFIARCEFTTDEKWTATKGECMWFAVALHDVLQERGIKNQLVAATERGRPATAYSHVMVRRGRTSYDIRGKMLAKAIHREFGSDVLQTITRQQIDGGGAGSAAVVKWKHRMQQHQPAA